MGMLLQNVGPLIARLMLVPLFFYSGLAKLTNVGASAEKMAGIVNASLHLPLANDALVWRVLIAAAGGIEWIGALLLLLGLRTRLGSMLLFFYLIPVTLLLHGLPWLHALTPLAAASQAVSILKNLALMAGLLMMAAFGPGKPSFDEPINQELLQR